MNKFVSSDEMQAIANSLMEGVTNYSDLPGVVTLITVPFVAARDIDPTTIPANVTEFIAKTSPSQPSVVPTPASSGFSLLWPDPSGGWTFVSQTGTYPVTVTGYRVDTTGPGFCGCQSIPPIVVNGSGETITIGEIRLPLSSNFFDGL